MNIQPTDIAILLISLAACTYCFVLSRRLQALQNTKNGLGATIQALSNSISAISTTTQETRQHASELATHLARQIEEANEACQRIARLKAEIDTTQGTVSGRFESAQAELEALMQRTLQVSESRINEMTTVTEKMQVISERTSIAIQQAIQGAIANQPHASKPGDKHHDLF